MFLIYVKYSIYLIDNIKLTFNSFNRQYKTNHLYLNSINE